MGERTSPGQQLLRDTHRSPTSEYYILNNSSGVAIYCLVPRARLTDCVYEILTISGVTLCFGVDGFRCVDIRLSEIDLHLHSLALRRDILVQFLYICARMLISIF